MSKKEKYVEKIIQLIEDYTSRKSNLKIIFSSDGSKKIVYIVDNKVVDLDSTEVTEKFAALLMVNKLITKQDLLEATSKGLKTNSTHS